MTATAISITATRIDSGTALFIAHLVFEAITHAVIAKRLFTGESKPDSSKGKGKIRRRIDLEEKSVQSWLRRVVI
jgi:hypothetical protein